MAHILLIARLVGRGSAPLFPGRGVIHMRALFETILLVGISVLGLSAVLALVAKYT